NTDFFAAAVLDGGTGKVRFSDGDTIVDDSQDDEGSAIVVEGDAWKAHHLHRWVLYEVTPAYPVGWAAVHQYVRDNYDHEAQVLAIKENDLTTLKAVVAPTNAQKQEIKDL